MAALLGLPDRAYADPPGRVWLFAFVDGQTRIDLQWNRNGTANPPVQDHKIEACQETADNDCHDADDADWTTLVAAHPQQTSTRHSNRYTHSGLSEGQTWHYRVWSRNDDGYVTAEDRGEATATTASMPMHMDESDNPTCDGARWKAYMTVATFGAYDDQGYRNYGDGALDNQSFMLGDTNYTVTQIYYGHERTNYPTTAGRWYLPASYHFAVTEYPFDPGKLEDLTLYVGDMRLPLSSYGSHTTQGFGEAYRWGWSNRRWTEGMQQSPYDDTFDYRDGDKVMVCLTDTAPVVTLVLTPDSISESGSSNSSTVTATIEQAVDAEFTVTVSAEAVSPAVAGDFTLSANKVLTFPANATTSTGTVTITAVNNNVDAPDKTVTVSGELSSGARPSPPSPVELTIRDDEPEPALSLTVDPATIAEAAGTSTIKVTASGSTFAESRTFTLTLGGEATETDDYTVSAKSLTLDATQSEVTATVTAVDDSVHEDDETIVVTAHHGANQVGTPQTITIRDDDLPVLSIADATAVAEGEAAQFVVTLTPASSKQVTVSYSTADGTAKASEDYTAASSTTLTFAPDETTKTVSVATTEDTRNEDQETFTVTLSGPTNATLKSDAKTATGTINDDDALPVLSIAGATVNEGEAAQFGVTLTPASSKQVTVSYSTADGTATASEDYTAASSTTLTFAPDETTKTVSVATTEDTRNEDQETFTVTLSGPANATLKADAKTATGTINDDDALPVLSIAGATVNEGEAAQFVVTLTPASSKQVTVSYSTADGTATASEDYTAASSTTLTFAPDETTKTVSVATTEDTRNEDQETFTVALSGETNATLKSDAKTATGTINDDDALPVLSIANATAVAEGEASSFAVTLTPASGKQVTVSYSTADGTATTSEDYTAASSTTLTFAPDETTKTITVATTEDTRNEDQETFTVTLSGPTNATLKSDAKTATGTIDDDDALPVLSIADATAVAEGEPAQFMVTLAPASGKQVTVSYSTADGTATASEDYTAASSTTLTFAAGDTTKTVSVATTEDTRNEDQETFTVALSGETNATLKADAKTATGTINDDDALPVLSIAGATVNEGDTAQFVVTLAPASGKQVTVSYSTADGTATASEDYTAASSTTLTFAAGDTTKTVSVATTEDTRNEDQETFTVALSGETNATLKADAKTATGTINDDDALPVLSIADATAVAEGEPAQFVVTLTPASGKQVTVSYSTADGTAKASEDYTAASSTTLTFAPNDTTKTISVATTEDTRNEPTEAFTLTLSSPTNATLKSDATTATGTINDDDALPVLSIADATAVAEGEAAQFVVTLTPASGKQVTVSYSTTDGTAKASEDYTAASSTTLTFAPNDTTKTISVATTEDTRNEPTEAFTVTISGPTNATLKSGGTAATGTINDDDALPVLSIADATAVAEGEAAQFVVTLTPASGKQVTVSYSTTDGTAKASEDYTAASSTTLTFAPNDTTKTISVATTEDTRNEPTEAFTVTISGPTNATLKSGGTAATGTINDDDALPVLSIADATAVAEGEAAQFVVTLTPASGKQVTVSYSTTDGTAKASEDYTAASSTTLTFAPNDTTKTISVATTEDMRNEPTEAFTVSLSGPANATLKSGATTATGTINDDDALPVLSIADATAVAEGEAAQFVVTLTPASGKQVTVSYSTTDGTAKASEDYTAASSTTLTFAPDDTTKTISVATTEDTRNEGTEAFTVTLSSPANATLKSDATTATGTISDDDALPRLSIADATVDEGDTAEFVVTLTPASSQQVTVSYTTTDGTAKASEDYTAASSTTLTFAPNDTTKTISVATTEDTRNEPTEAFTVTISGPTNATLKSDATTATGTINDDDALPVLSIADATAVAEGEAAQFVVTLTPASGKQVTVSYSTTDGTAKASEDYTAASSTTLTFAPNDTTKTISVATTEDTRNEPTEAFTVTISGPTNATLKSGGTAATGTINDDDALPVLSIADATAVAEGEAAQFVVTLTPASGKQVTVSYSTTDGTAKASEDYTAASSTTLTFAPNDTTKTISVATTEDTRNEPTEAFTVTISGPTNATLKSGGTAATGTINDDDALPVLSIADATAVAEGEAAQFVVTLTPASGKQVTVSYSTTDGTAKASEDYTAASSTTLTFAPNDTTKTISVATTEDTRNEPTEAFTVTLSGPANATLKSDATTATGTINDDDPLTAEVTAKAQSVTEGQSAEFEVKITGGTSTADVVVLYSIDGTATSADYDDPGDSLTITAGAASGTITIATKEDEVVEPSETLTVTLTSASTASRTVTVDGTAATTTIVEQGSVTVSIKAVIVEDDESTQDVDEYEDKSIADEGASAEFAVELSGAVSSAVQVSYETENGTAESGTGKDYTAKTATTLTFNPSAALRQTFTVATHDDALNEATETFTVKLTAPNLPAGVALGQATATGRITDGDPLTARVTANADSVDEGRPATFTVSLTGGTSTAPVVVHYSIGGSATSEDYTAPDPTTLTIGSGASSGTFTIETLTDNVVPETETLEVTLDSATSAGTVTVSATAATTAINNTTRPTLILEDQQSSSIGARRSARGASTRSSNSIACAVCITEGDTATGTTRQVRPMLVLPGTTQKVTIPDGQTVTIDYETSDGTAQSGQDYVQAEGTLTFTGDPDDGFKAKLQTPITLQTIGDTLNEPDRTFTLTLLSATLPDSTTTDAVSFTVAVRDDDPVSAAVEALSSRVNEGQSATFRVNLSGGTPTANVVVSYTVSGSATSGDDYTAPPGTLTIASDGTSGTITIETLADGVREDNDETMVVTLTGATTAGTATVASQGATATIAGEGPPAPVQPTTTERVTVTVSAGAPSVNEGQTATFDVTRRGGTNAEVRISYSVGGTATPGDDYTAPSGTLTIGSGAASGTIAIDTLADDVLEPDETLVVELDGASAGSGVTVTLDVTQATTTIVDGAGGASSSGVTVSVAPATVTEGDDASFAVELSGKVADPVTVNWSAASGPDDTADEGTDYIAAGGTLTFAPMETSGTVQVTTLDDRIGEPAETFTVTLTGPDLPAGVTLGTAAATGTIVDAAALFVTVTAGSATVAEGSPAVFAVALSGGTSTEDVVVAYAVGGTATAGDDYAAPAGTLTIAGGASGASLVIRTLADDVLDPGETLEVTLTGATTATGAVNVSPASAATTITDAGSVAVAVAPATVTEGDVAGFGVELSGKVAAPVTLRWSAASGPGDTAEAGTDYTAVGGTLTFVPGETRATVRVSTVQDAVEEADETFTVTLAGSDLPAGVTLGTAGATGTIVDDDATPPTATLTSADEFPATGTFSVTITFSEAVTGFAPDDIQVTNGTAANLAGGHTVYSVDVTPNEDFAGDVTVAIPDGAVIDAHGHGNIRASADFAADTTSPVVEVDVSFGAAAYTATEEGNPAAVAVLLSADPERTVVIPITARNRGGATDGDYSGVPDQVTFASGQTSRTFTVTATSDADEDAGEAVTLGFGELPEAVSAGSPRNATITLAGESSKTRYARVVRTLLPEAAVAMTDTTVGAIGDRIDDVAFGNRDSLSLAGVEMLTPLAADDGAADSIYWSSRDQVRNFSSARLIEGSSFVMTLADRARLAGAAGHGPNPGSAAVWGSGDYRNLKGSEDALAWRGNLVSLHLGADLVALPNLVAGLALSRSVVGFDYTDRTNPRTVTGTFETDLLGVHPYASWTPAAGLGFWATGGLGWGGVGIDDSLDALQTSTTRLLSGAVGGSGRVLSVDDLIPGGATALFVKGEGFLTGAWAEENGLIVAQDVGVQQVRLSVEGSHQQRGMWGSVLTPALELGLRHDSGDAAQGAGVELGGELRYVQPELGLTVEGRGRVLATHRSTTEEWGVGGRVQLAFGEGRQGLSLSLAPSLGVAASGTHALWEHGVADGDGRGSSDFGDLGASARLDARADYRLLTMGGLGMLTPYGGLSLSGRDGRDYRAGARLETDTFNLSLEGKRSERGTGTVDHGVTVRGAVRF